MPALLSRRITAQLLILAAATAALFPTEARAVSSGCQQVNAGAWNAALQSFSIGATLTGFDVGDRLHFTVSGHGQLTLLGSSGGSFLSVLVVNTPGSGHFTVGPPYTTFRPLNDAIAGPLIITTTCTPAPNPPNPVNPSDASHSRAVTGAFLAARVNGILLNDPSATSLLNRSNSPAPQKVVGAANVASGPAASGSAMGLGNDASTDTVGPKAIRFSQSLSQLRRQAAEAQMARERMSLGAGGGGVLPLAYEIASPWDIWVEVRYSAFDDDTAGLDRKGHVGVLYLGGDYRVTQNMIVGVLVQLDRAKDDSDVYTSKVAGNGWLAGPYMSARIDDNVYFDLRAAWGRSSNSLTHTNTETSGDFDTTRWLVKGTLSGNWVFDYWRITPSAELAYAEESQNAFINSAGTLIAGQDVSLGRLQFGPEIGYRFAHSADTFIEPFAGIKGVWDFADPDAAIIDDYVVGPGDFWGRLQGGLNVVTSSGWQVRSLASWDGLGTGGYDGYTLQGIVKVPLN